MTITRFWLIRHALVEATARARVYGNQDVPVCQQTMASQLARYTELAGLLPRPAVWLVTPLSRTRDTARAIFAAGYPTVEPAVEPSLIEQDFGDFHGLAHAEVPALLTLPAHDFWPLAGAERPPGGESVEDVIARVGVGLDRLADAHAGKDVVAVSHGGAIRAAVAHALGVGADAALRISVQNLSLTRLERHDNGAGRAWRVVSVNEIAEDLPPG